VKLPEELNSQAYVSMDQLFSSVAESLADFPEQFRIGIVASTRKRIPN